MKTLEQLEAEWQAAQAAKQERADTGIRQPAPTAANEPFPVTQNPETQSAPHPAAPSPASKARNPEWHTELLSSLDAAFGPSPANGGAVSAGSYRTDKTAASPNTAKSPGVPFGVKPFGEADPLDLGIPSSLDQSYETPGLAVLPQPTLRRGQPEKPDTRLKKVFRAISNILFWTLCISMVVGSIFFALSKDPRKSYGGYRFYTVLTQSMTPKADGSSPPGGFNKGDIIIVKMCEAEEVVANDIITFNPNPRDGEGKAFLTHRVLEVLDEVDGRKGIYFITKGDANPSEDPPIPGDMVIGKKVFTIPKLGGFLSAVRKHFILAIAMLVSLFACIAMLKWYLSKPKEQITTNR
jgi:signal peptidase I